MRNSLDLFWMKSLYGFENNTAKVLALVDSVGTLTSPESPSASLESCYSECREVIDRACREMFVAWAEGLEEEEEE